MKIIHETEFNELMKKEGLVLVDFFATWCGPCKMLAPVLEETAQELQGKVEIVKVDVDQDASLAANFRIMSVPAHDPVPQRGSDPEDQRISAEAAACLFPETVHLIISACSHAVSFFFPAVS